MNIWVKILLGLLFVGQSGQAQPFLNLNFESANLPALPAGQYGGLVSASNAIPGWTAYGWTASGTNQITQVLQNNFSLGANSISVFGPHWTFNDIIQGNYTVGLTAGYVLGLNNFQGVSISQTGLVPLSALSLLFAASGSGGDFQVSLGGQNLVFAPVFAGSNYTLYGANISNFAGSIETLTFSESTIGSDFGYEDLDAIQFSPSPVPEPGVLGLSVLGGIVFAWRLARRRFETF